MTTEQTYAGFIIKINENATTDGISCDKGRFCMLFNREQNKLIEYFLDKKFEDDIRYIQKILVADKRLSSSKDYLDYTEYPIPKNYLDFSNLYIKATKDKCERQKIDCFEIKDDDRNQILRDEFNKPSFKYRETPFNISSNSLKVYTAQDFTIDSAYLSYYRYPAQIGLVNPENPESAFSSQNPEFDDKFVNRVIDLCAASFYLNTDNQKFQAEKVNSVQKP